MPILYSREAGKLSTKTLWVDDFLALKLTNALSPTTASFGFKTYVKSGQELPIFESEGSYIQRFEEQTEASELRAIYEDFEYVDNLFKMNAPRRSSMLANGMASVPENPNNPSANPVNGAFQRREARQHMFKAMRAPPLQYAWTFWHDKHAEGGSYEGRLTAMLENIVTIKPFWEVHNTFPLDALKMKDSVHFFKRGVRPVWEDPRNVNGGAWTFRVPKDKSGQTWLEILLIAIGEGFADVIQPKDDLCGISYSVRFNSNLITVWNRDGNNQKSIDGIRDVILEKISPEIRPREGTYYYKRHSEHAGFNDVVSKAAAEKEAAKAGKIEEAAVTKEEERKAEEEAEKEEAEAEAAAGKEGEVASGA